MFFTKFLVAVLSSSDNTRGGARDALAIIQSITQIRTKAGQCFLGIILTAKRNFSQCCRSKSSSVHFTWAPTNGPAVIGLTVLSSILWVSLKSPSICFSSFKMTGCRVRRDDAWVRKAAKPPFCRRLTAFCRMYLLVIAPSVAEVCTVLPLVVVNLPQTSSVTLVERRFDFLDFLFSWK